MLWISGYFDLGWFGLLHCTGCRRIASLAHCKASQLLFFDNESALQEHFSTARLYFECLWEMLFVSEGKSWRLPSICTSRTTVTRIVLNDNVCWCHMLFDEEKSNVALFDAMLYYDCTCTPYVRMQSVCLLKVIEASTVNSCEHLPADCEAATLRGCRRAWCHCRVPGLSGSMAMERHDWHMVVSWNEGIPKSSILVGFSIINHPFGGTPMAMETHISTKWF